MAAPAENRKELLAEPRKDVEVVRVGKGGELHVHTDISVGELAAHDIFVGGEGEVGGDADGDVV